MAAPAERPGAPEPGEELQPLRPETLKKRRDFLAAARGLKHAGESLVLQARRRREDETDPASLRVGYTCSKKVGGAVVRNRAKRRLRAAAAAILPSAGRPGWDYVLIGREGRTATLPFPHLLADLEAGLARVHAGRKPR